MRPRETQVYDPNFQHKGGKKGQESGGGAGVSSQEGKLNMIRVKRLKFTLKGSNYEDAQNTALGGESRKTGLSAGFVLFLGAFDKWTTPEV